MRYAPLCAVDHGNRIVPNLVNSLPKYRKHRASGQAVVTINGRDRYLRPHGTKASQRDYDRLVAEYLTSGRSPSFGAPQHDVSVVELCADAAAAGFVNQQVFPTSAITLNPNGVYLAMMWLPSPGVPGSSRDFASGPVIPNSLFPFHSFSEIFLDGSKVETLQDQMVDIRSGNVGLDGAGHRAPSQVVWYPWADSDAGPNGRHEIRWSLRDNQGNGWDIVAPFDVVPEPTAAGMTLAGAIGLAYLSRARGNKRCSGSTKAARTAESRACVIWSITSAAKSP